MAYDPTRMAPTAQQAWSALSSAWGSPLDQYITSGYRTPEYNAQIGGAKGSQHLHGNAYDIATIGMDQATRERLIQQARAAGFGGIGVYDDSLHFDVGPQRAWGADYTSGTLPEWAATALSGGSMGAQTMPQQPQPMGLLARMGMQKQDPNAGGETAMPFYQRPTFANFAENVALALNPLRTRPDQNLEAGIQAQRQQRMGGRTAEWLAQQPGGEVFAKAIQSGANPGQVLMAYQSAMSGSDSPASYEALRLTALAGGLVEGTPEYQQFMLNGGATGGSVGPAAVQELAWRAEQAGLVPGTPEYQDFMRTGGVSDEARARAMGTESGKAAVTLSGLSETVSRTNNLIDLVLNDPALPKMIGPVQGRLPNVSADAQRFQSRLDQLRGTAFLEAYNMLRGGGQITENEGRKAEQAMIRLNTAQTEDDFKQALIEFKDAVDTGYRKLQAQAGVSTQPQGGASGDPLGLR